MATAPTLFWYDLSTGTLAPTYFGQLNTTVAALCSENAVTAPTAPWYNQISCSLVSTWLKQIDTALRSLCTALGVDAPATTLVNLNVGQYEATYWQQLDATVRALCGPVNYVAPAITPNPAVAGDLLTASNGTWSSGANPVYTYQWWVDGSEAVGETDQTYQTTSPTEDGLDVYCVVTLTNDTGANSAQSDTITLGAGTGYHADAVHFAGAGSSLVIAALSCTDGTNFSMSVWYKTADQTGSATIWVLDPDGNYANSGTFANPNRITTAVSNAAADDTMLVRPANAISGNAWHHMLMSIDTNHGIGAKVAKVYIDDVDATEILQDTDGIFTIGMNGFKFTFGDEGFGDGATMDVADPWIAMQTLLTAGDISEATRRKFISATGKPVDLGADGSTPTGTAPDVFFSGDATGFVTNKGTGGAASLVGALTNASTSPSD